MVQYVIQVSSKSEKVFKGTNTLEQEELIESIIIVSDINSDIEPNLRLMCLKVIRKVIELQNPLSQMPASTWESSDFEGYEDKILQKQKMLNSLGVVKLLANLIAFEPKRSIKEEALLVAIACLLNGNFETQQKFFEYIVDDTENQFIISL